MHHPLFNPIIYFREPKTEEEMLKDRLDAAQKQLNESITTLQAKTTNINNMKGNLTKLAAEARKENDEFQRKYSTIKNEHDKAKSQLTALDIKVTKFNAAMAKVTGNVIFRYIHITFHPLQY